MKTQDVSSVKNDQKEVYPALDYTILTIWPTAVSVTWEQRSYLTHYMLGSASKNYYHGPAVSNFTITGLKPDTDYRFFISGYKDHQGNIQRRRLFQ